MKKVLLMLVACAAMTACQQKGKTAEAMDNVDSTETMDSLRFQGEVPAADGPGIKYTVTLAGDSAKTFTLEEVYLQAKDGKDDTKSYTGQVEVIKKDVKGQPVTAYKLAMDKDNALYLLVKDDATLRVVNDQLEEAASANNYDLKLVK